MVHRTKVNGSKMSITAKVRNFGLMEPFTPDFIFMAKSRGMVRLNGRMAAPMMESSERTGWKVKAPMCGTMGEYSRDNGKIT